MVRPACAGYDSGVAGLDEARARSVLADMQDRLARDPSAALGVPAGATVDDVRSAFLELTKQFHPVRFGRMAVDVQKMANEVFLSLRAAHDGLAKALRRQSGPIPRPPGLSSAQPTPINVPPAGTGRTTQPLPPRPPVRPGSPNETGERAPVQPPPTTGPRAPARPPVAAPVTAARPGAARPVAAPAPPAPAAPPRDENAVIDLLQRQQWDQAKTALHQLQARDPSSKRIKALMSYARGREAQLDGRVDDARVELHDAVDMDPGLQLAKTALTELFTRRK